MVSSSELFGFERAHFPNNMDWLQETLIVFTILLGLNLHVKGNSKIFAVLLSDRDRSSGIGIDPHKPKLFSVGSEQESDQPILYLISGLRRKRNLVNHQVDLHSDEDTIKKKKVRVKRSIRNYGKKKPPQLNKKCCLNAFFCVPWACIPSEISWKKVPSGLMNRNPKPDCYCNDPYFCPPGCKFDPSIVDITSHVYQPKPKKLHK